MRSRTSSPINCASSADELSAWLRVSISSIRWRYSWSSATPPRWAVPTRVQPLAPHRHIRLCARQVRSAPPSRRAPSKTPKRASDLDPEVGLRGGHVGGRGRRVGPRRALERVRPAAVVNRPLEIGLVR